MENIRFLGKDHPFIAIIASILSVVILILSIITMKLLYTGQIGLASNVASLTSALATVLLAALTAIYVVSSKTQNRMIRKHQNDELQRQLQSLRKGLLYEIKSLSEARIQNTDYDDTKYTGDFAPKTVFQRNADQIGMLTEDEVESITEYYQNLTEFEEYLHAYSNREGGGNIPSAAKPLIDSKQSAIGELENHLKNSD